jgi:hypothetical protein
VSRAAISVLVLLIVAVPCTRGDAPKGRRALPVYRLFDSYGQIKWEDEQAHLDNLAIQLMNEPGTVAYIFIYDGNDVCIGEAQARAVRAKRYLVEHRGVPWNRVIWRHDGYSESFFIQLQPVSGSISIPYPFLGPPIPSVRHRIAQNCRSRMARIKNTKW